MTGMARREAGGATLPLLLLLALIVLGGWNYHRNWMAEKAAQGPRPFKAYSAEDLGKLRNAYAREIEQHQQRYAQAQQRRFRASSEGLIGERLGEFERIQANTEKIREAGGEVAEREARLREIEMEIDYRMALGSGYSLHLKRLTTI